MTGAAASLVRPGLVRSWVVWTTAGELVGFAVPASVAAIGVAQWWVLRKHLPGAGRWIVITAAAWLAGLAAFLAIASPLWHEGQSPVVVFAIGALGGLVMAAVVAVVTGLGLRALLSGATP